MSTNFPGAVDTSATIPAEGAAIPLSTNHVTTHQNIQDAIEAIEAKVGADSSAVTTSHDYKLSEVTDKAAGKTATQTLTNKTLTSPVINVGSDATGDMYYRNAGVLTRIPVGTDNQIMKLNGTTPNWEAETTTVDASTTVKGIVEAATSAEVTAGTATGGTGAVLAVTPDALAASTPVFNGSGLTNISTGFLTSGAPLTTTTNTSATLVTYALAGGILGTNKGVRIRITVQAAITASNNSAIYSIAYGGTSIGAVGYSGNSGTPTVTTLLVADILLLGSGATGTQRYSIFNTSAITSGSGGAITSTNVQTGTTAIDSTASQNITIACTAGASVTGTLIDYVIHKIV